jgi:hypothetical protein
MQYFLDIVAEQSYLIDMEVNVNKTVCMVLMPTKRRRIIATSYPPFHIGNDCLKFVERFKYLGHRITNNNNDIDDKQREVCNMFIRTNTLLRKFNKCSVDVKIVLLRSFCICLYDAALWAWY